LLVKYLYLKFKDKEEKAVENAIAALTEYNDAGK